MNDYQRSLIVEELEITPKQLKEKLDRGDKPMLLDVRRPDEWEFNHLAGATFIPIDEIEQRRRELPRDEEIIVYCHVGSRSLQVARYLQAYGYNAKSLNGGIEDWAAQIDPSIPRY